MPWLPPRQLEEVVHPTETNVVEIFQPYVVPHIHPSHTEYRYHNIVEHRHYCPHTVSQTCDTVERHVNCCCPTERW